MSAASPVAAIAAASHPAAADPSADDLNARRAAITNASAASTTFVATVMGSVRPPHRGSSALSSAIGHCGGDSSATWWPVPFALESLVGVVLTLEAQKLRELRIAAQDLLARSERVIRQEPAAVFPSGDVDEAAERGGRVLSPSACATCAG
jgi:hypothetical protein